MLKKFVRTAAVGVTLAALSVSAQAAPIGISLVVDESGSIGGTNFATQQAAYVAALTNVLPTDGSVALGFYTFDTSATTVFSFQIINSVADLTALTTAINAIAYNGGGTDIATGINLAASQMSAFGYGNLQRAVIDVSTDGQGGDSVNAALNFVSAASAGTIDGVANVNCLGIGAGANCNFETGPDSFEIINVSFADMQSALETKLRRELNLTVPEPASLALMALGLLGIGGLRRKQRA